MNGSPASRRVLITGAGIGGLATALALAKNGFASAIVEKRENPAEEGAGIQIGPNGVHVLRHLGVADALAPYTASPTSICVMDGISGRQLTKLPLGEHVEKRYGAPYWCAHRADLHAALLGAARTSSQIEMIMGREITTATSHTTGVRAQTSNGDELAGCALIAADGILSNMRNTVFAPALMQFTGLRAFRAVIPSDEYPAMLAGSCTHIWLSPGAHAVHYPVRSGRQTAIIVVFKDDDASAGWGSEALASRVQSQFADAPAPLRDLIGKPENWRSWPLMIPAARINWVNGRLALLGDAAHPILPFLAQGAVMALEDAVVLARELTAAPDDVPAALQSYASRRVSRTGRVADAAQRNGRAYHLSGLMAAARNLALRTTPPNRLLAHYDWLYAFKFDR